MPGLVAALRGVVDGPFVFGLRPLMLETPRRLRDVRRARLLTADLDDPLGAWLQSSDGRKLGDRVVGWTALAELAEDPAVAAALHPRRTHLPTDMALASPRLAPALEVLLPALRPH